ncbi:MAG TPA: VOC family protein [Acidimicrobiia bacterium]|nr:VOC family protein [Acidimicrobiia bacterium]
MPDATAVASAVPFAADATQIVRPTMHHVNLKTTRLQEMIDWYGIVIGARPNFQADVIAFLTNDDANHRIALTGLPGLADDDDKIVHTGMHHSAFEYDSLDALLASFLRLRNEGIVPSACLDHGLTMSFYYVDPDGNMVELQADNYGDWAKSTEFLRTDERFVANPIGEFVDPEKLVEARREGLSPTEVHDRAYGGEYPPSVPPDIRLPL